MGPLEQFLARYIGSGSAPNDTTMAQLVNQPGGMLAAGQGRVPQGVASGAPQPTPGALDPYANQFMAAGAAMMQSPGNFGQALGSGLQAGLKQVGENAKAAEALGKGAQGQGAGAVNFAAAAQQQQENAGGPQWGQQLMAMDKRQNDIVSTINQLREDNKLLLEALKANTTPNPTGTAPTVPPPPIARPRR